jgi:hypothetical protein
MDAVHKEHPVFKQLSEYSRFYKNLATSVMGWVTQGTMGSVLNIDTYVYSSMQGTLDSIKDILIKGRINDSYALLRKYHDSVIINVYSTLYLEDNFSFENFVVEKINDWLHGKEQLPEYRIMSDYIRKSEKLADINALLYKDNTYKEIRDRCNDHTHYNFYHNLLLNDNELYIKNRFGILNRFSKDLENLFILHLSYLFYINDKYMMSSDYIDSMDLGLTPEEGSQYFVAPFIQEIFDKVVKKNRIDLAIAIKNNTAMKLE